MLFRETNPNWVSMPTDLLLKSIPHVHLRKLMRPVAAWYELNLPMWLVLQSVGYNGSGGFGYPHIGPGTDEEQLSCILPTHGSTDERPSSRYYQFDKNDGTRCGHLYCWGPCQKAFTSYWYLWTYLRGNFEYGHRKVIVTIEEQFGVPFPREIVLNADPDRLDDFQGDEDYKRIARARFVQNRIIRNDVRPREPGMALAAWAELYSQPLTCTSVEP